MAFWHRVRDLLDVLGTIAVIVAAVALLWTLFVKPRAAITEQQAESVTGMQIDAQHITNVSGNGPIAIIEFSDFRCPFCAAHANEILPIVKRSLVVSGKARYIAFHYPLDQIHPLAIEASEAAECAGKQGEFWQMHERLFGNVNALMRNDLMRHAGSLKLDENRFQRCLDQDETLIKVLADQAEGRRLGVRGTPTIFIGTVRADGTIELVKRFRGLVSADTLTTEIVALGSSIGWRVAG